MNPPVIALLAFVTIFCAALIGLRLHAALPNHHLSPETKEVVRLGIGLIATMTALLLGLLVATAKGSYDTQRSEVIQIAAKIAFLDRALATYGPETGPARDQLRLSVESTAKRMWSDENISGPKNLSADEAKKMYDAIQNLPAQSEAQKFLKARALDGVVDLSKTLWLLSAQAQPSIVTPMLVAVVLWLSVIFLSFGLFAPANKTVIATLLIVALTVSTALLLILELDRPFDGVIQISSVPIHNVLSQVGK